MSHSVSGAFERRRTPTADPRWFEAHLTLAATTIGTVVVWAAVHRTHAEQVCIMWPTGGKPTAMLESDIPVPANRWEFRTSGLWAEQVCETANEHWSYGLEAFALELDDAHELVRTGYGTRVPMGWELDFYAHSPARWLLSDSAPVDQAGAYTQPGILNGDYLDADGATPTEGPAQRWHWWGTKPLSSAGIRTANLAEPPAGFDELHLPLSQGPVALRRNPEGIAIQAAPVLP